MILPEEFTDYTRRLAGDDLFHTLCAALSEEPPVSVRLNERKCRMAGVSSDALSLPRADGGVPWCSSAVYLSERPSFTYDPLLHAGLYYVQEAGSMFLEQAIRRYVTAPAVALDLCAAPGGKSTHARALLPEGSLLVSNEPIRNRAQVLAENIVKWGHPDCIVTQNYPKDFTRFTSLFDVVIADVPCSGEGMFRKDAGAVEEWSTANVELCRNRQREILADVWPALRPGGLLIYSTCTYNDKENEENIDWIADELGASVLPIPVEDDWQVEGRLPRGTSEGRAGNRPVYHFLPGRTRGEGFFLAVLRKDGGEESMSVVCDSPEKREKPRSGKAKKGRVAPPTVPNECLSWVCKSDNYAFLATTDGRLSAFPRTYVSVYTLLNEYLTVLHVGIPVAELKGRDWIPSHALALSTERAGDAFPVVELGHEQAVAYLRRETLTLPPDTPRGYVLLAFRGAALGFAKNVGNRANNLYPAEWRIRSSHISPFCLWEAVGRVFP